jgi:hypothetical protein
MIRGGRSNGVIVISTAKRTGRWMAYLGLGCGILYSFGGLLHDLLTIGLNLGTALAFMALIGMPVLFGTLGFILGLLIASVGFLGKWFIHRVAG